MVLFLKFIKFCIVGFSGLLIDFGITYFLKEKYHIQKYMANAIGFVIAASSNFFFNRIWTFNSQDPLIVQQYFKFILVSVIGLGINHVIITYTHERIKIPFYYAKVVATVIVVLWNFIANYFFTF